MLSAELEKYQSTPSTEDTTTLSTQSVEGNTSLLTSETADLQAKSTEPLASAEDDEHTW